MMYRSIRFAVAVLAFAMFLCVSQSFAQDKTHEGKIVKAADGKLTMTDMDGTNKHTHSVMDDATITFEGKDVKLAELKEGYLIKVTTKIDENNKSWVTKIEARPKA
jgi:hypothetical protein